MGFFILQKGGGLLGAKVGVSIVQDPCVHSYKGFLPLKQGLVKVVNTCSLPVKFIE
jgi:hypothetical protein